MLKKRDYIPILAICTRPILALDQWPSQRTMSGKTLEQVGRSPKVLTNEQFCTYLRIFATSYASQFNKTCLFVIYPIENKHVCESKSLFYLQADARVHLQ